MKRWTIKELGEASDLKFAACILNERRAQLNPYTPLAQKLETSKNLLLRMDAYLNGWGSGTSYPAEDPGGPVPGRIPLGCQID